MIGVLGMIWVLFHYATSSDAAGPLEFTANLRAFFGGIAAALANAGSFLLSLVTGGEPQLTVTFAALEETVGGMDGKATPAGAPSPSQPEKTERLELYAPTPENLVPVRTDGREAVLLIKRETGDEILAKLQAVRDAKVATEDPTPEPADPEAQ